MVVALYIQALVPWMPVSPGDDPVARAYGWDGLAGAVREAQQSAASRGCTRVWAGARTYQAASETSFHLPDQPFVLSTNVMSRANQYDLWPGFPEVAGPGDCLVLFGTEPGTEEAVAFLRPHFDSVSRQEPVVRRRGAGAIDTYSLWLLRGWSGDRTAFDRSD